MPQRTVICEDRIEAPAESVWCVVSDFCGKWHPLIHTIEEECSDRGSIVRRFTVHGDDAVYREKLIYWSDSDHVLSYAHVEGIAAVENYVAEVSVSPVDANACKIVWRAEIVAPEPRAAQIAEGTRQVFGTGISALKRQSFETTCQNSRGEFPSAKQTSIVLEGTPRLAVLSTPAKAGPLVIFLHGIGGSKFNWQKQLDVASAFGQGVALDLRGYGDSQLGDAPTTVQDYCDDILRVMRVHGQQRVVLCGLSYGSWIATSFAMRHPNALAGLVLSGGCTGMSEAPMDEREGFRKAREVPILQGKKPADFASQVVEVIAGPNATAGQRAHLLESMAAIPAATYLDAVRCFTQPIETFDFQKIDCPVLLMTGEFDRLASPSEIRSVARRIASSRPLADVRFEIVREAGHVCNIERPDIYNEHLATFLARIPQ